MKKRGVSSTEVARLAGVSRTTVSFVLNSTPGKIIPEETRTRVIEAARTLNYVPDEHAKRVAKSARMTVGFLVSHSSSVFSDAYILRLIEGMAPLLNKRRCGLMLVPVKQRTTDYLGIVKECGLDGVIVTNTHQDDAGILALAASNVPLVVIGTMNEVDVCQIDIDNRQAARQTVEYLIGLGHRRIGLIAHAPLHYYASQARKQGYEDALAAEGMGVDESLVRIGDFSEDSGYRAMSELLDQEPRPSAVFAGNDAMAYGAIQAVYDRHLSIPGDLSIVGFDDDFPSRFMFPPLTTMTLPAAALGERAAAMLVDMVSGLTQARSRVMMQTHLSVRESAAALA